MRPRPRTAIALLSLASFVACRSKSEGPLDLVLPLRGTERAGIVAIQDFAEDSLRLEAIAISKTGTVTPIFATVEKMNDVRVTVLLYDAPLSSIRLDPGPIAIASEGVVRALPKADRIFSQDVENDKGGAWTEATTTAPDLAQVRIRGLQPCVAFDVVAFPLGTFSTPKAAIGAHIAKPPLGFTGSGVLVSVHGEEVHYLERNKAEMLSPIQTQPCGGATGPAQIFSGFQAKSGDMWVGGDCGKIYVGPIDVGNSALSAGFFGSAFHRDPIVAMSGPSDLDPVTEVFLVESSGVFERFEAQSDMSTDLDDLPASDTAAVAYVGPGEGFVVSPAANLVVRYRNGKAVHEALPGLADGTGLVAGVHVPGFGDVVASTTDVVYRKNGHAWNALAFKTPPRRIRALAAYKGSFVVLEAGAVLRQYSTVENDLCDPIGPIADKVDDAQLIAVSDGEIALVGVAAFNATENYVRWLSPLKRAE